MLPSNEIMILNIAAIASAIRCGNRIANNIPPPAPALGSELDGEDKINRKPKYRKVIARDILFKTSEKSLFFILQPPVYYFINHLYF